ncbi:DUF7511 domain-containing protein [Halosegnis marinus]|uniref:DUF7511 domain-containing protein n=1 Tax=Halosegnis marinus TaxID=3034023 RepID=A0ABD5ZS99_9EURY|nr:hypothetical protein [Halosegnis sp. DT85]
MRTDANDDGRHGDGTVLAAIERHDGGPDECTLYPVRTTDEDERMTVWITAAGESFVGLDEMQ